MTFKPLNHQLVSTFFSIKHIVLQFIAKVVTTILLYVVIHPLRQPNRLMKHLHFQFHLLNHLFPLRPEWPEKILQ